METIKPELLPQLFRIASNSWGDKKFKLRNRFAVLTDEDLYFREGGEQELSERLQAKLNKSAADVNALIAAL